VEKDPGQQQVIKDGKKLTRGDTSEIDERRKRRKDDRKSLRKTQIQPPKISLGKLEGTRGLRQKCRATSTEQKRKGRRDSPQRTGGKKSGRKNNLK